jgi:transposase
MNKNDAADAEAICEAAQRADGFATVSVSSEGYEAEPVPGWDWPVGR